MAVMSADQITIIDVTDAYSVMLSMDAVSLTGGEDSLGTAQTVTIYVSALMGAMKITPRIGTIECPANVEATVGSAIDSVVPITVLFNAAVKRSGKLSIPVTVNNEVTITKEFAYSISFKGEGGTPGKDGKDGKDGFSPVVTKSGDTVTITDADGHTVTVKDGADGHSIKGDDGEDAYVHIAWANSADGSTDFSTTDSANKLYMGTYTDHTLADSTKPSDYAWVKIKGEQGTKGDKGDPGVSITGVTNYYLATNASSGVTRSTSGWTTGIQAITESKQYLWNYEVTVGSDGSTISTTDPVIIGRYGKDGGSGSAGRGIAEITEYYCASASTTAPADSEFSTSVQTTTATKKYLWNYEKITYTSGNPETTAKRIIGTYGDKGDKGDKGDTGAAGAKGDKGDDGVTYYTYFAYATSSSGADFSKTPTSTSTYIGVCITKASTQPTTPSSYTWSLTKGNPGAQGEAGAKGDKGEDGITRYTYFAYATSSSGANFSKTPTASSTYIGVCTTTSATQPTTASSYTWSLTKGNKGDTGAKGDKGDTGAKGDKGDQGVSVTNVTSTNNTADGGTSVITVTLSDGTTKTFNVKNGNKGNPGANGASSQWYYGNKCTHTSGTAKSATGIASAIVGDMYLNTDTYSVYRCTTAGASGTAVWTYAGNLVEGVIDGIEIGGRNLFIGSTGTHIMNASVTDTKTTTMLYFWTTPGKSYTGYKSFGPSKTYSTTGHFTETFTAANDALNYFCIKHNGSTHDFLVYFDVPKDGVKAGETLTMSFDIVGCNPSVANGLDIKNFKLERGNKATDWTPAPEDMTGNPNLLRPVPKYHNKADYAAYSLDLTENLKAGQTYTLQLWDVDVSHTGKTSATLGVAVYWGGGNIRLLVFSGTSYFTNGHADHLVATFTVTNSQASGAYGSGASNAWLNVYNSVPSATGTKSLTIGRWKIEKGSVPTRWSVSDEDAQKNIETAISANTTATTANNRATYHYGTCATAIDTAAKVVTLAGFTLYTGAQITVKFTNGNSAAAPTLNVNSTGAKAVIVNGATSALTGKMDFPAGTTGSFTYDGSHWQLTGTDNIENVMEWTESGGLKVKAKSGSKSMVNVTASAVDIYDKNGKLGNRVNDSGMTVYKGGSKRAEFFDSINMYASDGSTKIASFAGDGVSLHSTSLQNIGRFYVTSDTKDGKTRTFGTLSLGSSENPVIKGYNYTGDAEDISALIMDVNGTEWDSKFTASLDFTGMEFQQDNVGYWRAGLQAGGFYVAGPSGTFMGVDSSGLSIGGNALADYVIKRGTSGSWTYMKWASGTAMCYGTITGKVSKWAPWGSLYYGTMQYFNYPSGLFAAEPTLTAQAKMGSGASGDLFSVGFSNDGSASRTPRMYPTRPTAGLTGNIYYQLQAWGRWK